MRPVGYRHPTAHVRLHLGLVLSLDLSGPRVTGYFLTWQFGSFPRAGPTCIIFLLQLLQK